MTLIRNSSAIIINIIEINGRHDYSQYVIDNFSRNSALGSIKINLNEIKLVFRQVL